MIRREYQLELLVIAGSLALAVVGYLLESRTVEFLAVVVAAVGFGIRLTSSRQ